MAEYIERQAAIETFEQAFDNNWEVSGTLDRIRAIPAANVVEVRHGQWLPTHDADKLRCSRCDVIHLIAQYPHGEINYCPNFGAKMDGGND